MTEHSWRTRKSRPIHVHVPVQGDAVNRVTLRQYKNSSVEENESL